MSVQKLLNIIRTHASIATSNQFFSSIGIITGYDKVNRLVTVQLRPASDDEPALQTGWIPLSSPAIGNNWGVFFAPNIGDLCSVHYQEGSLQNAYADSLIYNNTSRPLPVDSGEYWISHKTGSFIKLTNDGKLLINGNVEIDISAPTININVTNECNINAEKVNISASEEINLNAPTINITADSEINIDSSSVNIGNTDGALNTLMNSLAIDAFNSHTHGGGAVPDIPMDGTVETTITKGN